MAFPSISFLWSRLKFFFTPPKGVPTPLLSTPGAPECHAVPQGTKCGANRAHGQVRSSRAWVGLEEGRGKDPGPGPKAEQRLSRCMAHGTCAKTANQRLSYCRWQVVLATPPYSPNAKTRRFAFWHSESPQTHNTRTTTHCRHHIAQCYPLHVGVRWRRVGSRLQLGETRMGPRHRQNGGQRRERQPLGTQLVVT
jgi:hypothetical protein